MKAENMIDIRKVNSMSDSEAMKDQSRITKSPPLSAGNMIKELFNLTPFESQLLKWSIATVGRSWSIIAEILHSYPLTSGKHLDGTKLHEYYNQIKTSRCEFYCRGIRLEPTADDGIPILGRFKPCLLMNRMLPVYPQQYAVVSDYLDKGQTKEEFKVIGKRRMRDFKLPSDYEIHELKYKRFEEITPFVLFPRSDQLSTSTLNISELPTDGRTSGIILLAL